MDSEPFDGASSKNLGFSLGLRMRLFFQLEGYQENAITESLGIEGSELCSTTRPKEPICTDLLAFYNFMFRRTSSKPSGKIIA